MTHSPAPASDSVTQASLPSHQPSASEDPFGLPLQDAGGFPAQLGTPLSQPARPAPGRKPPVKRVKRGFSWEDLTESEQKWISTGTTLLILGFLAMILPSFGFTLRRLARAGDFAPLIGALLALGGSGCIATGLGRFPGLAGAIAGCSSLLTIVVCVFVMLPVFAGGEGTEGWLANRSNNDPRSGKSVEQQLEEQKKRTRQSALPPKPATGSDAGSLPPLGMLPGNSTSTDSASGFGSGSPRATSPKSPEDLLDLVPDKIKERMGNPFENMPDNSGANANPFANKPDNSAAAGNPLDEYFAQDGFLVGEASGDFYELKEILRNSRWIQLNSAGDSLMRETTKRFGPSWQDRIPAENLTKPVGGSSRSRRQDVYIHPEKAPIAGVRLVGKEFGRELRLQMILPVYDRGGEDIDVLAESGYALAGMEIKSGDYINGVRLIFMKLDGTRFEAGDSYKSNWLGASTGKTTTTLAGDGRAIFGFVLSKDTFVRQISLVCDPE